MLGKQEIGGGGGMGPKTLSPLLTLIPPLSTEFASSNLDRGNLVGQVENHVTGGGGLDTEGEIDPFQP